MKVTFAEWGNYTSSIKNLIERLGVEVIMPEKTNSKAIEEGAKLSPELFCFPLKVNIGNYIPALKKGADTIFMWENLGGSCRMRYYWIIQEKILQEAGFNVKVLNLNSRNILPQFNKIRKENNISFWQSLQNCFLFFRRLNFVDRLEKEAQYIRPREKNKGQADQILPQAFKKLEKISNGRDLTILKAETKKELSKIKIEKNKEVVRVGIIGEIYTIVDGTINFGLEKKLGEMGIEVHRKLDLSQHLLGGILPWKEKQLQKKVNPYLKSTVGGHGRQAIEEMLDFAKNHFDGVIQLLPFGCMPEVTVRPILQEIGQKNNLPFLSISLDEQTAETGIQTRLEAFVDLLFAKAKSRKGVGGTGLCVNSGRSPV